MRALLPLAAAAALAGCISFGAETPEVLLTLTPETPAAAPQTRSATAENSIAVIRPSTAQALETNRIPVLSGDTEVAYLKDAQWVDTPNELFRRLLGDTIAARTGRVVLDPLQTGFTPANRLTGQLVHFGVDALRSEAVVTYEGVYAQGPRNVVARRFEARVPVAAIDRANVAPALNSAANRVAAEVAAWIASPGG